MSSDHDFVPHHLEIATRDGKILYESDPFPVQEQLTIPGITTPIEEGSFSLNAIYFKINKPIRKLTCRRKVYKVGLCVNTSEDVLGNFEPSDEMHFHKFDDMETPKGFFVRGKLELQLDFVDETKKTLFTLNYAIDIVKAK